MKKAKRELLCQNCDKEYNVWFASNKLWNQVVTDDMIHFLCPTCFIRIAEKLGIVNGIWKISIKKFK